MTPAIVAIASMARENPEDAEAFIEAVSAEPMLDEIEQGTSIMLYDRRQRGRHVATIWTPPPDRESAKPTYATWCTAHNAGGATHGKDCIMAARRAIIADLKQHK